MRQWFDNQNRKYRRRRRHGGGSRLAQMLPGDRARIVNLASNDKMRLQQLSNLGLVPGSTIAVRQHYPAWIISIDETELALDDAIVELIEVQVLT